MAYHAGWQRRDQRPSIRRQPALAAIASDLDPQHEVLHHEILVALETRAGRHLRLEDPLLHADPWRRLAATTPPGSLARRLGRGPLLHPARLDPWAVLQSLQPRDLRAQLCDYALLLRILVQQRQHQLLQLGQRQAIDVSWDDHIDG